jgi:sugar phosphate isomerase/epimerase
MSEITRREFHQVAFAGVVSALAPYKGVTIGVQSYSFRDRPLDGAIQGLAAAGIGSCELWQGHVEPRDAGREALRRWRLEVPLKEFEAIRAKFDRAGIELSAYNLSFQDSFTDEEIARGFEMAKALGVNVITASANQQVVRRVAPAAERARIRVGMHNHSRIDPNEFATPDDFERAMAASPFIATNLDIGHFTAANFDAVDFLTKHHDRIVTLHIKDRKRDQGPAVPFGEGDAPIKQVLMLLRDRKWAIPANIEYEYKGEDTLTEVKRCLDYCKQALTS